MNKIHFLRAVWNDVILIESDGLYGLIDTGIKEAYELRIRPYFQEIGLERLEFILITHFHRDHYGSLPAILRDYPVGTVYMKGFSGLNSSTSNGRQATDEYNRTESALCADMCEQARNVSNLVMIDESLEHVRLGDFDFRVFGGTNAIREMYEDPASPYKGQIRFGENTNSAALFCRLNGTNIYLGGDANNESLDYPKYDRLNDQYCQAVKALTDGPIDLMKAPHHLCGNLFSEEALAFYRPRYVVATNWTASVYSQFKGNVNMLKAAREDVRLLISDRCGYVFTLGTNGQLSYEEIQKVPEITLEEIEPAADDEAANERFAAELNEFWKLHIRYLIEDGIISSAEDIDYFSGEEYRSVIEAHMKRDENRHHLAWFVREGKRIGACSYCIYDGEDGKCFLLDFWVFKPYRGDGCGHHCVTAFFEHTKAQGAAYYELNCSLTDPTRFWKAHGFVENGEDEWGEPLFIRK